jgi:hypothetical protein
VSKLSDDPLYVAYERMRAAHWGLTSPDSRMPAEFRIEVSAGVLDRAANRIALAHPEWFDDSPKAAAV